MVGIWWLPNFSIFLQRISTARNLRGFKIVTLRTRLTKGYDEVQGVTKWSGRIRRKSRCGRSWHKLTYVKHGWLNEREKENDCWTIKKCWKWRKSESASTAERSLFREAECRSIAVRNARRRRRRLGKRDSRIFWMLWSLWSGCRIRSIWRLPRLQY